MSIEIGRRISSLRYLKGWGPEDLAKRAKISRTALFQIESGATKLLRAKTLVSIARALKVAPEFILNGSGESKPETQDNQPLDPCRDAVAIEQLQELLQSDLAQSARWVIQGLHSALPTKQQQ